MFTASSLTSLTRAFRIFHISINLVQMNVNGIADALHRSAYTSFHQECLCSLQVWFDDDISDITFLPKSIAFLHISLGLWGLFIRHCTTIFYKPFHQLFVVELWKFFLRFYPTKLFRIETFRVIQPLRLRARVLKRTRFFVCLNTR